ncbi:gypsy retrotransposon integrase-like protein 1 [Plakobranchus ocellatus]|uniref:Gypsy retrotransposon integrase-like protein 1 n=1 Tax=Plakobranchus ocellatus TaxID=259542 RepID=A0AAV4BTE5_9GAST|nr:gypsy retrotransposon integrase-like protein 1 [Plakobranchus ocellatus]
MPSATMRSQTFSPPSADRKEEAEHQAREKKEEAERQSREKKEEAKRQAREKKEEAERRERKEEADRKERLELEKMKLDAEMKLLQAKIEAGIIKNEPDGSGARSSNSGAKHPKLPNFQDGRDDLDIWLTRINNTALLAEKAVISFRTPFLSGEVKALCIPDAICDVIIGNVERSRSPEDPDMSMVVAHNSITGAHLGIRRTKDKVLSNFYRPGVDGDVTRYCRSCDVCQRNMKKGTVPRVPLEKVPLIGTPFKRVAIDLVGPINPPSEAGQRFILSLVDYATRFAEAVLLRKIDTQSVAEALVDIYSRLGVP